MGLKNNATVTDNDLNELKNLTRLRISDHALREMRLAREAEYSGRVTWRRKQWAYLFQPIGKDVPGYNTSRPPATGGSDKIHLQN